ncbi:MAG: winged helix-turn-helix domain-containing protein [Alphaproteobacteria bacterium]|nr:winged helix-turn-helix domain-containing protein [Alphaproteobacteria bacterium]
MLCFGLISSDDSLSHAISEQLKEMEGGWQCALFPSVEEALGAWGETLPPLLFWDCEQADTTKEMTEFFAHRLGQARPSPLLLALGEPPELIESVGITEVFSRPLRLGYLLTRLQFYRRVLQQSPDVSVTLGPWIFAPRKRQLSRENGSEPLKLTEKEAGLLEYLCAAETPIPRDELLAAIWGYDSTIDTHTLETHIYRLRRKLMSIHPDGEDVFVMERGGYAVNPSWRMQGG